MLLFVRIERGIKKGICAFRLEHSTSHEHLSALQHQSPQHVLQQQKPQQPPPINPENQEKMLSVSGKKKCSHCGDELGMDQIKKPKC